MIFVKAKRIPVCEKHGCPCVEGVGRRSCIVCECVTAERPSRPESGDWWKR